MSSTFTTGHSNNPENFENINSHTAHYFIVKIVSSATALTQFDIVTVLVKTEDSSFEVDVVTMTSPLGLWGVICLRRRDKRGAKYK